MNGELNANLTLNIESTSSISPHIPPQCCPLRLTLVNSLFPVKPVIKEVPKVVTIRRRVAVIECRVQSVFEPQCIFSKDSTIIKESSNKKVHIERITDGEYVVKLELDPCTAADKGSYKLTVKNEKGEVSSTNIEVTEVPDDDPVKAPVIGQKLKSVVS